jgi:hypothetical protein
VANLLADTRRKSVGRWRKQAGRSRQFTRTGAQLAGLVFQ